MCATHGYSSMWATHGYYATAPAAGRPGQLDIGRGSSGTERVRVDWDGTGHIVVCDREHDGDGER
jgi:hypothetical protein